MDGWMAWLGLDLSQNITPPRAPCGAKNYERIIFPNENFALKGLEEKRSFFALFTAPQKQLLLGLIDVENLAI